MRATRRSGRHADALFRMLHAAPFGVRVQALALLQQLLADRAAMSDRFYRCAAPGNIIKRLGSAARLLGMSIQANSKVLEL